MKTIDLEFGPPRRTSPPGVILLLLGAVLGAFVLSAVASVRAELEDEQQALARIEATRPQPVKLSAREETARRKAAAAHHETIAGARAVSERLAVPWARLLTEVERADSPDVAVIALSPDPNKRLLRIDALARDLHAMLDYNARLSQSAMLSELALVTHERVVDDPDQPVRFSLTAVWKVNAIVAE